MDVKFPMIIKDVNLSGDRYKSSIYVTFNYRGNDYINKPTTMARNYIRDHSKLNPENIKGWCSLVTVEKPSIELLVLIPRLYITLFKQMYAQQTLKIDFKRRKIQKIARNISEIDKRFFIHYVSKSKELLNLNDVGDFDFKRFRRCKHNNKRQLELHKELDKLHNDILYCIK